MSKKIVLLTCEVEAENDLKAVFEVQRYLTNLPSAFFDKFNAFEVLEAVE